MARAEGLECVFGARPRFLGQKTQPEGGIFDELLPSIDEPGQIGALDDAMIARERDRHDQPPDDLVWIRDAERRDLGREARQDPAPAQRPDRQLPRRREQRMRIRAPTDRADIAQRNGARCLEVSVR